MAGSGAIWRDESEEGPGQNQRDLIRMENVQKTYHVGEVDVEALQGLSIRVRQGEFLALTGPSGCGKSTLLHLMGALDRPTSGRVWIDGRDVATLNDGELARLRGARVGFVFQTFNLYPTLSALGNVELPMMVAGVSVPERRRRATKLLEATGLGDRKGHLPSQLSGGQRQRVAIARAMANRPAAILADEPTGNLDSRSGQEILEILEELHRKGTTLVIVTHDPAVSARAEHIISLLDGRLVED